MISNYFQPEQLLLDSELNTTSPKHLGALLLPTLIICQLNLKITKKKDSDLEMAESK
jgi:hypothetical protein